MFEPKPTKIDNGFYWPLMRYLRSVFYDTFTDSSSYNVVCPCIKSQSHRHLNESINLIYN